MKDQWDTSSFQTAPYDAKDNEARGHGVVALGHALTKLNIYLRELGDLFKRHGDDLLADLNDLDNEDESDGDYAPEEFG